MSGLSKFRIFALLGLALLTQACDSIPDVRDRPPVFIPAPRPTPRPVQPRPQVSGALAPAPAMVEGIRSLWASYPDRAGIAVIRSDGNWVISHRGDEPMPQQSVSKLWVAIAFMDAVDQGRVSLSDPVTVMPSDIVVFSTAMQIKVGSSGYSTTYGELMELQLTKSDNTANDVLMRKAGGAAGIRAMLSAKGLSGIRFGPGENLLQAGTAGLLWSESYRQGKSFQLARSKLSDAARQAAMDRYISDPPDGATPVAIARALLKLKRGELLSANSTQHILRLMAASETGKQRLRAGTPLGWGFAHKTGTGQDFQGRTAGYNDVSIMTAPDGTSYAVVVQIADTTQTVPDRMQFMQGISATVGANHVR